MYSFYQSYWLICSLSNKYAKRGHNSFILQNLGYINYTPFKILLICCNIRVPSPFLLLKTSPDAFRSKALQLPRRLTFYRLHIVPVPTPHRRFCISGTKINHHESSRAVIELRVRSSTTFTAESVGAQSWYNRHLYYYHTNLIAHDPSTAWKPPRREQNSFNTRTRTYISKTKF